jgi:hypothetical protein
VDVVPESSVGHAHRKKREWRPTKLERRVQDIACRRAARQLLRVSRKRFQKAQQEYLEWEAFSLWVRAIIDVEGRAPVWMLEVFQKHCPGFFQNEERYRKTHRQRPGALPLRLLEWIHNHVFSIAKREGWLDALIFYTVRNARSQRTWAYWEQCEGEWRRKRPRAYPSFEEWSRAVEKWKMPG